MMRKCLSLTLLLFLPVMLAAQQSIKLQEKTIYKDKSDIILEYRIEMDGYEWCELALYVSYNGGKSFLKNPLTNIVGDVGRITSSGDKKMIWQLGKNVDLYAGRDISFKINVERSRKSKASKAKEKTVARKSATFIMAEAAGISPYSYGLMIGWSSPKIGFYVKGLSNFNFDTAKYTVDDTGKTDDGYIFATGNTAHSMLFGTVGILIPAGKAVYFNLGAGYGSRSYLWETGSGEWAKVESSSTVGIAADLGIIFKIKKFVFSIGAVYIVPNSISGQIGIGVAF